jgi:hypothetical protein
VFRHLDRPVTLGDRIRVAWPGPTGRCKSWFTILRLYGPLPAWFDQTWRPGEIEPVTGRAG